MYKSLIAGLPWLESLSYFADVNHFHLISGLASKQNGYFHTPGASDITFTQKATLLFRKTPFSQVQEPLLLHHSYDL